MEIRSFLAFELPQEIKGIVARVSSELIKSPLDLRYVKVENIHLTVVFMGNIKTDHLAAMKNEIQMVCLKYGPFEISINGMGCFPNRRNPRVLWLGLHGDMQRMALFRDDLQRNLKPFGIKEEKRTFKPHLTLGRFRKPNKKGAYLDKFFTKYDGLSSAGCSLIELTLFKSDLKPGGAEYTKLNTWPLSGDK